MGVDMRCGCGIWLCECECECECEMLAAGRDCGFESGRYGWVECELDLWVCGCGSEVCGVMCGYGIASV